MYQTLVIHQTPCQAPGRQGRRCVVLTDKETSPQYSVAVPVTKVGTLRFGDIRACQRKVETSLRYLPPCTL